jgi:exopolyphosphatase / guanosine-5'-triphosphate,3'-diphosphate pyrophosphatase
MLCACIDIGSNTTRLLVAQAEDGQLREVLQQRAFTRLGGKGEIGPAKVSALVDAVCQQVRVARECGCGSVRAVATHAIRQAPNREQVLDAVSAAAGIEVDVLTGDEEARYAFAGATRTLGHLPLGEVGVVDVGGGSTELVCGTLAGGVSWSASFRVGSGFLAESYLRSDPPELGELERLRRHVQGVFEGLDCPRPANVYAVGGSATSLRRLVGGVLDHETLQRGVRVLTSAPANEIARRFELHPLRARLLPAGILLLDAAADALGAQLQIAKGGLREGVLLEALEREGVLR